MIKSKFGKQTRFLHLFMIAFFILLLVYFPNLKKFEDYFIFSATILFSLHFWYGAYFLIKTLGPTRHISEGIIDICILTLKITSIYTILFMPLWFFINGVLMGLGVLKYHLASKRKYTKKTKGYIHKKIFIELMSISSFFILALLTLKIQIVEFHRILSVVVFGIQLPFLYWMFFKEKVYNLKENK